MLSSMVCTSVLAGLLSAAGMAVPPAGVVAEAEPTVSVSAQGCPAGPAPATIIADEPWPQHRYDITTLSQITDGSGVTVAVVDSGVDARHPQLAAAVRAGADMLDRSGDGRTDCVGHGTAVASIIAARPMAGSGLRGLAPGAHIVPIRVSERVETNDGVVAGEGGVSDLVDGIRAAIAHRPRPAVINLSLATPRDDDGLRAAVRAALEADIVVVAAVGNRHEQGDPSPFPASYDGVVGVGAIGRDGLRLSSSQVGAYVDLVAPGDGVVAAAVRRGHAVVSGTSFATAFVTATAALIRARWPELSRSEVVRRLIATADPPAGSPSGYGHGVVNPLRALTDVTTAPATARPAHALTPGPRPRDEVREVSVVAIAAAALLMLLAAAVVAVAETIPRGRRRGWRAGAAGPRDPSRVGGGGTGGGGGGRGGGRGAVPPPPPPTLHV